MAPVARTRTREVDVDAARRGALAVAIAAARDLIALTKPRITLVVLITAAGGMKLAHAKLAALSSATGRGAGVGGITLATWLYTMIGTALIVGSANALNMYWERDVDALMQRTKNRPLPAGRLSPPVALWFGIALAVVSLPMLTLGVNPMTALLGAVALVSYVLLYTPMKRHSVRALWVGAVPGAIPPLLGFTAITGRLDWAGVALFSILFVWQIPHFLAISTFRADDYEGAGLKVVPVEKGDRFTNWMIVRYSLALVAVSVWPYLIGIGGRGYLAVALFLGLVWMSIAVRAFRSGSLRDPATAAGRIKWARSLFAYSIFYLVLLFGTLVLLGSSV